MSISTLESGVYFIQNIKACTVLDLDSGSDEDGTKVFGNQKLELSDALVPEQLWIISKVHLIGSRIYTVENAKSGTFLELTGNANSTPVVGNKSTGNDEQRWAIIRNNADTGYIIQNQATSTFIDLHNGDTANLTPVNGWNGSGVDTTNTHQLWEFVKA